MFPAAFRGYKGAMGRQQPAGQLRRGPGYFEEPTVSRWLFASTQAAWIWLIARLWLGWLWFEAGWGKVFGGSITWRFWRWGGDEYSITGPANIGWIRGGTTVNATGQEVTLGVGDSVAGFAARAVEAAQDPRPAVEFGWYVGFLEWIRDTAHPVLGPLVAVGELLIGLGLLLGAFVGLAAFFGAMLNFSFLFAGVAGINPAMVGVSFLLVLAWRNAGWIGLDRWLLPALGTPWQRGALLRREQGSPEQQTGA